MSDYNSQLQSFCRSATIQQLEDKRGRTVRGGGAYSKEYSFEDNHVFLTY